MAIVRAQAMGALHSRTIENRMARENSTNAKRLTRIIFHCHTFDASLKTPELVLKSHNVVPTVHIDNLARNRAAGVGGEKHSGISDFFDFHTSAQGSAFLMAF